MSEQVKKFKNLKNYITKPWWAVLLPIALPLVISVMMLWVSIGAAIDFGWDRDSLICVPLFGAILMLLIIPPIVKRVRVARFIRKAKENGELQRLEQDFSEGIMLLDGVLVLGRICAYGRYMPVPVRYDEIKKLYEWFYNSGGLRMRRLKAKTIGGKERTVCILPVGGLPKETMAEIENYFRAQNELIIPSFN